MSEIGEHFMPMLKETAPRPGGIEERVVYAIISPRSGNIEPLGLRAPEQVGSDAGNLSIIDRVRHVYEYPLRMMPVIDECTPASSCRRVLPDDVVYGSRLVIGELQKCVVVILQNIPAAIEDSGPEISEDPAPLAQIFIRGLD
jgi:hypothetical protein